MDEKNNEPIPCPFCGTEATLVDNGTGSRRVACLQSKGGCGAVGRMTFDNSTAINEWNRRATPASSAPGDEVASFDSWYTGISIEGDMKHNMRRAWNAALAAHPAAAPDSAQQGDKEARQRVARALGLSVSDRHSYAWEYLIGCIEEDTKAREREEAAAQQGEDEPPLPEWLTEGADEAYKMPRARLTVEFKEYARTYHAHMMRKLGDGGSIDTPEFRELVEAHVRHAVNGGTHIDQPKIWNDLTAHIDAKLAQARAAGAERAVPEGFVVAPKEPTDAMVMAGFNACEIKAVGFASGNDARKAIYRAMIAAAPSPAAAKEGGAA